MARTATHSAHVLGWQLTLAVLAVRQLSDSGQVQAASRPHPIAPYGTLGASAPPYNFLPNRCSLPSSLPKIDSAYR